MTERVRTRRRRHQLFKRWNVEGPDDRSNPSLPRAACLYCEEDLPPHWETKKGRAQWYCNCRCCSEYSRAVKRYEYLKTELHGPWNDESAFAAAEDAPAAPSNPEPDVGGSV